MPLPEATRELIPRTLGAIPPVDGILIATSRVRCEQPCLTDFPLLTRLFTDPVMTKDLGGPVDEATVRKWLNGWIARWATGDALWGIVVRADTSERIGSASIHPSTVPDLDGAEISYMILPEHQRQGYASETARELVRHAKETLRVRRLLITADPQNELSNRIAAKLGFTCLGERHYKHGSWENHTSHHVWVYEESR